MRGTRQLELNAQNHIVLFDERERSGLWMKCSAEERSRVAD